MGAHATTLPKRPIGEVVESRSVSLPKLGDAPAVSGTDLTRDGLVQVLTQFDELQPPTRDPRKVRSLLLHFIDNPPTGVSGLEITDRPFTIVGVVGKDSGRILSIDIAALE